MKNKKSVFVLLPAALLIWGAVAYQFFSYSAAPDEGVQTTQAFEVKPVKTTPRDTQSINAGYRDPFLGHLSARKSARVQKPRAKAAKAEVPIVWPDIRYKGMVSDVNANHPVFMLTMDQKTVLMKRGQTQNGVFLAKGDRKSVVLSYQKQTKAFPIQDQ